MRRINDFIKAILTLITGALANTKLGSVWYDIFVRTFSAKTIKVSHNSYDLTFTAAAKIPKWRAETFSEKEPETLDWIETFNPNSVFWDIGANVGIYGIYAAKVEPSQKVFSFEPNVFNLEYLARNINLNRLQSQVTIIANPLSDRTKVGSMNMSNIEHGGSLNAFDTLTGFDGNQINLIFSYQTTSFCADDLVEKCGIEQPDYIKMDVDGIEGLILDGASQVLKNKKLKSILLEVNDDVDGLDTHISRALTEGGFTRAEIPAKFGHTCNQIWNRQ